MCQHAVFTEDSVQSLESSSLPECFIEQSQSIDGQLEMVALKGISGELIVPLEMWLRGTVVTAHHEGLCCSSEHPQLVWEASKRGLGKLLGLFQTAQHRAAFPSEEGMPLFASPYRGSQQLIQRQRFFSSSV